MAFQEAKKKIASAIVLTHYNPGLPIKLAADASAYGVGAVDARWLRKANRVCFANIDCY